MTEKIKITPEIQDTYEFTPKMVERLIEATLVYKSLSGEHHYKNTEMALDVLEYLDGGIPFKALRMGHKPAVFDYGLFRDVAIVKNDDGAIVFCPTSWLIPGRPELASTWDVHDDYSGEHQDDTGFETIEEALAHAKEMGWNVAVVQA